MAGVTETIYTGEGEENRTRSEPGDRKSHFTEPARVLSVITSSRFPYLLFSFYRFSYKHFSYNLFSYNLFL